jgi:hypothetical protein
MSLSPLSKFIEEDGHTQQLNSNSIELGYNPRYVRLHSPARPRTLKGKLKASWKANKGLALVMISQLFGTLMNVTTRMLETEGNDGKRRRNTYSELVVDTLTGMGYHPFQILFARMGITVICASFYMWYNKTEHFPFGMIDVRLLLVARALLGFFAVFGMYCESLSIFNSPEWYSCCDP